MLGYDILSSFDTTKGKLCWCGIFTVLAMTAAISAACGAIRGRP